MILQGDDGSFADVCPCDRDIDRLEKCQSQTQCRNMLCTLTRVFIARCTQEKGKGSGLGGYDGLDHAAERSKRHRDGIRDGTIGGTDDSDIVGRHQTGARCGRINSRGDDSRGVGGVEIIGQLPYDSALTQIA